MSNSPLVCYTKISPNCTKPRNQKITHIVVHHMAGNASIETCGEIFARPSRRCCSNYGIGSDGRIALYCDEANRSWCSSSGAIDHKAITIEVANDGGSPDWHVSDKAFESLVALCTDICKRNGIASLNYTGDKSGNLHMHKWYAATGCPGPYLGSKFPELAKRVNANLKGKATTSKTTTTTTTTTKTTSTKTTTISSSFLPSKGYFGPGDTDVKIGQIADFMYKTFPTYTKKAALGNKFGPNLKASIIQFQKNTGLKADGCVGPLTLSKLCAYGFDGGTSDSKAKTISVGDKIKIAAGSKYTTGGKIPTWVLNSTLYCREISGNTIAFSTVRTGAITGKTLKSNCSKA